MYANHPGYNVDDAVATMVAGQEMGRGLIARNFAQVPYGSMPFAAKFDMPLIDRAEWPERIRDMEKTKSRTSDLLKFYKVKPLNQGRTNYCWFNSVVSAMYCLRARDHQPFVELSPASGAAKIKRFRNQGGWSGQALEWIVKHGVARAELWPANAIDRRYDTEEAAADAETRKITEWLDLEPGNFDQVMTCLLLRIPVPVGYNWWKHAVCLVDPVIFPNGGYGARLLNSWGEEYGQDGYADLPEEKATPDDAVAPRVVNATVEIRNPQLATAA